MTLRAVRTVVAVVCVGGIAGMIASSIADNNGAAITCGLLTAVAILCSMVATAVANTAGQAVLGGGAAPVVGGVATEPRSHPKATAAAPRAAAAGAAAAGAGRVGDADGDAPLPDDDAVAPPRLAAGQGAAGPDEVALGDDLEARVRDLVAAGADEEAVRGLVRSAVRFGRSAR